MRVTWTCPKCGSTESKLFHWDMTIESIYAIDHRGFFFSHCDDCREFRECKEDISEIDNDARKLNKVLTQPNSDGYITIFGAVGSGKTLEYINLKESSLDDGTDESEWKARVGKRWVDVKQFAE